MHISYSELKIWAQCPYKHKLMYIDKIKGFIGNEYATNLSQIIEAEIKRVKEEKKYKRSFLSIKIWVISCLPYCYEPRLGMMFIFTFSAGIPNTSL